MKNNKYKKVIFIINLFIIIVPILLIKEIDFLGRQFKFDTPYWWIVPVGIAFYSMQLIAYVVDVYAERITPERNLLKFLLFVSFFPQIIQGPIPRFNQLEPQLISGHKFNEQKFAKGFMLILWAFFLKLCISDKAGIIVNTVFDHYPTYKGMYVVVAGILYSFQLYTDFQSCTLFAKGIAESFGINIIDNFDHPYFSTSVKDFWRRWHISLSTWLRDYIYIPLGGNKKGKYRKYINILLTFATSGIWHGSGFKFLFWGLMHGTYQIVGEMLSSAKVRLSKMLYLNNYPRLENAMKMLGTFVLVTSAWIIFRADSLKTGLSMLKSIVTVRNIWILTNDSIFSLGLDWKEVILLVVCLLVLLIVSKKQENGAQLRESILAYNLPVRWSIYIGAILFIVVFGTYGYGYDAQSFIYGGF